MKNYFLILAAFCLVSFWGCSESPTIDDDPTEQTPGSNSGDSDKDDDGDESDNDGNETPDDGEETETPSVEFEAETDTEPTIEADGGEIEVTFTATAEWTAEVIFNEINSAQTRADAWCTVYPESGEAGTATITVAAEPNESTEERSATIVILCGEASISLTLTQSGTEEKEEEDSDESDAIPNNEIRYTSSDGNIVALTYYDNYTFGESVSMVSHSYENGQGIITCDDDITTIIYYIFSNCSTLTSITIPNSVTTLGEYAFMNCSSLTNINIPDSVTTIGNGTFSGCSSLANINIPNSVTHIGTWVFYKCESLTNITIPESVTTIADAAFFGCNSLTSIYCKAVTPPSLGGGAFYDTNNTPLNAAIYVPEESVGAYKATEGWSLYADRIYGYNFED